MAVLEIVRRNLIDHREQLDPDVEIPLIDQVPETADRRDDHDGGTDEPYVVPEKGRVEE